ncbi:MAG: hypothetical protein ACRDLD_02205 [Thermoleophilaceae bacterium]
MLELLCLVAISAAALTAQYLTHRAQLRQIDRLIESFSAERRKLLNRIQAPQAAAYESDVEPSGELLHLPVDDDDAYEAYAERQRAGEVV